VWYSVNKITIEMSDTCRLAAAHAWSVWSCDGVTGSWFWSAMLLLGFGLWILKLVLANMRASDAGRPDVEAWLDAASPAADAAQHLSTRITSVGHVHRRVSRTSSTAGNRLDALSAARHSRATGRRYSLPRRQRYFAKPGWRRRGTVDI